MEKLSFTHSMVFVRNKKDLQPSFVLETHWCHLKNYMTNFLIMNHSWNEKNPRRVFHQLLLNLTKNISSKKGKDNNLGGNYHHFNNLEPNPNFGNRGNPHNPGNLHGNRNFQGSLDHFNCNNLNLQHSFGVLNMAITQRGLFVKYVIKLDIVQKHVVLVQLYHLLWKIGLKPIIWPMTSLETKIRNWILVDDHLCIPNGITFNERECMMHREWAYRVHEQNELLMDLQ